MFQDILNGLCKKSWDCGFDLSYDSSMYAQPYTLQHKHMAIRYTCATMGEVRQLLDVLAHTRYALYTTDNEIDFYWIAD